MRTVKNSDYIENPEFEKLLKNKMNELSENVDCFDKIAERAYMSDNVDFSDSEFTVTDLENVTGKRSMPKLIKWGALVACAVLCIGILPKSGFARNVFSDLKTEPYSKLYTSIADKIVSISSDSENYRVYDLSLDEYIRNDVLVTPLFCCPFEDIGREDVRVKIYIRTIESYFTNEVYAVEYCGEYTKENFIAAAESKAEFTDEEIAELNKDKSELFVNARFDEMAAWTYLSSSSANGNLTDKDGNEVTAASFIYDSFFKDDYDIVPLTNYVFYCHDGYEASDSYRYDEASYSLNENECTVYVLPDTRSMWKVSVYCDGTSAMPAESISNFTKGNYFSQPTAYNEIAYIIPFGGRINLKSDDDEPLNNVELHRFEQSDMGIINSLVIPDDKNLRSKLKIYHPCVSFLDFSSYSEPKIVAESTSPLFQKEYFKEDMIDSETSGFFMLYPDKDSDEYLIMPYNSSQNISQNRLGIISRSYPEYAENNPDFYEKGKIRHSLLETERQINEEDTLQKTETDKIS